MDATGEVTINQTVEGGNQVRNKRLTFLSLLALAGLLAALAAGPALAWSYLGNATRSTWKYPLWPGSTPTITTPANPPTGATPTTPPPTTPSTPPATTPSTPPAGVSAMEQRLFDLVNQDRLQNGLKPLALDEALSRVARMKAQDLVANNYFSHYSPTYGWPPQMVRNAGISYRYGVGENIVETTTVERMNLQLMNSPSHRANILDPNFTHVGIGIVPDKYGAYMGVQEFIGR